MNLEKDSVRVFIYQILSKIIGFAFFIGVVNIIGSEAFGEFLLFQGVLVLLTILSEFGLDGGVEKRISGGKKAAIIGTAVVLKLLLGGVVAVGILLIRPQLDSYIGAPVILWAIPSLFVSNVKNVFLHALRGEQHVEQSILMGQLLQSVLFVGLGISASLGGHGVLGLIGSFILSQTVVLCVAAYSLYMAVGYAPFRRMIGRPNLVTARSLVDYSKYDFVASTVSGKVVSWADTLLIGLFLSTTAVTAYEAAWRLSSVTILTSRAVANVIFPRISHLDSEGATAEIEAIIPRALPLSLLFVFPAIPGVYFVGDDILQYLFGADTTIAATAFFVVTVGRVPQAVNAINGRVLKGLNRPDLDFRSTMLFLVLNVSMNLVLIPAFGIVGAGVATTLAYTVMTVLNTFFIKRMIDLRVSSPSLYVLILLSSVIGVFLWLYTVTFEIASVFDVVGVVLWSGALYGVLVYVARPTRHILMNVISP